MNSFPSELFIIFMDQGLDFTVYGTYYTETHATKVLKGARLNHPNIEFKMMKYRSTEWE